jgi:regulator of sirC expression with transglutaminase-like and TPR domain
VISERFRTLAAQPEWPSGLAEGALILAAEMRPELDVEANLETISDITERAQPLVSAAGTPSEAVTALNHALFELEGFRGNQEAYGDPRNSDLEIVLTRRRGIPITLSVLYVEVARRLGLDAHGVGFPGHFLCKVLEVSDVPARELIVDPFFGRVLSLEDCADRVRAAAGEDVAFDARWLRPASSREIYVRMLNNLKLLFLQAGDGLGALGCFDRILLLAPELAQEFRDRGLLLERMDCIHAALDDFSRFLEMAPTDPSAAMIRARRDALTQRKPALN